jgi:hypothetical protein
VSFDNGVTQGKKGAVAALEHINETVIGVPPELADKVPPLCENVKCRKRLSVVQKFAKQRPKDGRWWPKYCSERCSSTAFVNKQTLERQQARATADIRSKIESPKAPPPKVPGRIEIQAAQEEEPVAARKPSCPTREKIRPSVPVASAVQVGTANAVISTVPVEAAIEMPLPLPHPLSSERVTVVAQPEPAPPPSPAKVLLKALHDALLALPDAEAVSVLITIDRAGNYTFGMPGFRPANEH